MRLDVPMRHLAVFCIGLMFIDDWELRLGFVTSVVAGRASAAPVAAAQDQTQLYGLSALLDGRGFVQIRAGEFLMGAGNGHADERPVHRVRISREFEMAKFEVTQAQWAAVMGSSHRRTARGGPAAIEGSPGSDPSHFKGSRLPVESVSWNDVQRFLRTLNARDSKHEYRLPTEAEWEYACRAGSTGDFSGDLDAMAWYEENSEEQTHPVGQKQPNAWGLYDMHGNVWEWVQDSYGFDYYDNGLAIDPQGPAAGSYRVYRGGCWHKPAAYCRSAVRGFDFPGQPYYSVGFRLVRTPKP